MIQKRFELLGTQVSADCLKQLIDCESIAILEKLKNGCNIGAPTDERPAALERADQVERLAQDADTLRKAGRPLEAEFILLGVTTICPQHSQAIAKLASLYESQHAYERTISFTKQLLEQEGANTEAAYQLCFALYKQGRADEALETILPYHVCEPSQRITRLCGLLLQSLGRPGEAIDILTSAVESDPSDFHSLKALIEIYAQSGLHEKSLEILNKIPSEISDVKTRVTEAMIHRSMGRVTHSISLLSKIIASEPSHANAYWAQCFNYSIAGAKHAEDLLKISQSYWEASGCLDKKSITPTSHTNTPRNKPIRLAFLASDIGEHVVSRFLTPLLRSHDKESFFVALFSTARRFEKKSGAIFSMADHAKALHELSLADARSLLKAMDLDIIIDTNGFTKDSGLGILGQRCAAVQCHYIGYHATTGLKTIDYFLGDSITTPPEFQWQYTEKLVQIPHLWMAYDNSIEFPEAISKSTRNSPVFGAFSQVAKINSTTLQYWAAAMRAVPDSILAIKDKGIQSNTTRKRIEVTMEQNGVDPDRVYFFGPVGSQLDHLDSYNAIDIALDTTPWSGATTAFEALGMGVPLVAICGDTTSSRMSTSVVSAAGRRNWIARSPNEFALIAAELANDYQRIRHNKSTMQKEIRSGILFNEKRICRDFYTTIEQLVN